MKKCKQIFLLIAVVFQFFSANHANAAPVVSLSPRAVDQGGTVVVNWSGFNGIVKVELYVGTSAPVLAATQQEGSSGSLNLAMNYYPFNQIRADYWVRVQEQQTPYTYLNSETFSVNNPSVSVSPSSIVQGGTTTTYWSGFAANVNVKLYKGSTYITPVYINTSQTSGQQNLVMTGYTPASDYRIRVELYGYPSYYEYSNYFSVTEPPPAAPSLYSPSDFTIRLNRTPHSFDWSTVSGANLYRIYVDNHEGFGSPEINQTPSDSQLISYTSLENNVYYWKVQAQNSSGVWGNWSVTRRFVVDTPPPAPSLSLPANGNEYNAVTSINFSWSGPIGYSIDRYYLRIVKGTNLNDTPEYADELIETSRAVSVSGWEPGTYTWAVRAIKNHPDGFSQSSYESTIGWGEYATRTFTIFEPPPEIPTLQSPANNSIYKIPSSIIFQWTGVSGAVEYELEVDNNYATSDGFKYTITAPSTSKTVVNPSWFGSNIYHWRIRAKNSSGVWGDYQSSYFQLVYDSPPPKPSLIGPVNGSTFISGDSIPASWSGPDGYSIDRYYLRIVKGTDLNDTPVYDKELTGTSQTISTTSWEPGTYTWAVRAIKNHPDGYDQSTYETTIGWGEYDSRTFRLDNPPAVLNVTNPTAGVTWYKGTEYMIHWTAENYDGNIKIHVYKDGESEPHATIEASIPASNGSTGVPFNVPTDDINWPNSTRYNIGIATEDDLFFAYSGEFTITDQVANTPYFSPLYRGYNAADTDHFYTTNPEERDVKMPEYGYTYEKIEGYISNRAFTGGVTLHRLYNSITKSHYYTTSDTERDTVLTDANWTYEGAAGYVYPIPAENMIPMYHLYSPERDDHFYTISEFERDYATSIAVDPYQNQGVAFFVAQNSGAAPLAGKPVATLGGVDMASGNFVPYRNHIDLANPPGFGLPFVFARTYNSQNASESGPLGPGWTHSYHIRVINYGMFALVKWGNGQNDLYAVIDDTFIPVPGVYNTLEYVAGSYILTTKSKTVYTFVESIEGGTSIGRLVEIRDRNGIDLDLILDPIKQGAIAYIEDGSGRIYRFHYQEIPVPAGSDYSETDRYRLTSINEENAGSLTRSISFGYDPQGRLTSYTNPEGHQALYAYEDADIAGLLTKITLPEGNEITAEYNQDRLTNMTIGDTAGNISKTVELQYNKIIHDPTSTYGTIYNVKTAADDISIAASHDDYKLGLMIDPLGNMAEVEKYANLNPTQVRDPNGLIWVYAYDSQTGNLKSIVNPEKEVITYTYDTPDNPNNLIAITDRENNVTRFTHDSKGNVETIIREINGVGRTTTIARYANGQIETITFPPNNSAGTAITIRYTYDAYGYPATITDHLGNTINFTYDAGGRLLSRQDADHVSLQYTYDLLNQVKEIADMLNRTTSYIYDRNGNLKKITDPRTIVTEYNYNDLDLVESVSQAGIRIAKYDYDEAGRRTTVTNAKGRSWTSSYDDAGNLKTSRTPLGYEDTFPEYYPDGKLKRTQARDGREINFLYDGIGRMTSSTIASGYQYGYTYWPNDQLKTVSRDGANIGQFTYDERGSLTSYIDPFGKTVSYAYYPGGNLQKITLPDSKEITYDYDDRNLLTSVSFWGGRQIQYEYTNGGRLDKIIYSNNTVIDYVYDAYFRLMTISNKKIDGTVIAEYTVNEFDDLDAPLAIVSTGGLDVDIAARSTTYSYDENNRIQTAGGDTFSHNDQGEVLTAGSARSFSWDSKDVAGRLQSMTINGNTSNYLYDGLGNRVAKTVNGTTTRYILDVSGRLANVLAETDGSGNINAYYIHGLGLAASVSADDSVRYYHYDRLGNTVALTDGDGTVTDQFGYDPDPFAFAMVSQGSTANPFTFVGRYGVMAEGSDIFYMRARFYDSENGRFLSEDPIGFDGGDLNLYAYVEGNPVVGIDPGGLWSMEDAWDKAKKFTEKLFLGTSTETIKQAASVVKDRVKGIKFTVETKGNQIILKTHHISPAKIAEGAAGGIIREAAVDYVLKSFFGKEDLPEGFFEAWYLKVIPGTSAVYSQSEMDNDECDFNYIDINAPGGELNWKQAMEDCFALNVIKWKSNNYNKP